METLSDKIITVSTISGTDLSNIPVRYVKEYIKNILETEHCASQEIFCSMIKENAGKELTNG